MSVKVVACERCGKGFMMPKDINAHHYICFKCIEKELGTAHIQHIMNNAEEIDEDE